MQTLSSEHKKMISDCYNSYLQTAFGGGAKWFACRAVAASSDLKELPFGVVYDFIESLEIKGELERSKHKCKEYNKKLGIY